MMKAVVPARRLHYPRHRCLFSLFGVGDCSSRMARKGSGIEVGRKMDYRTVAHQMHSGPWSMLFEVADSVDLGDPAVLRSQCLYYSNSAPEGDKSLLSQHCRYSSVTVTSLAFLTHLPSMLRTIVASASSSPLDDFFSSSVWGCLSLVATLLSSW